MDRRSALKAMAAASSGLLLPQTSYAGLNSNKFGWSPNQASLIDFIRRHRYPYITQKNELIKGTG